MKFVEFSNEDKIFKFLDPNMKGGLAKSKDRNAIKELQQWLNDHNYNAGSPDGFYGKKTVAAVKQFQSDANITVDGDAGKQTITAMVNFKSGKSTQPERTQPTGAGIIGKTSWNELTKNKPFINRFLDMQEKYPGLDSQEFSTMIQRESAFNTKAVNRKTRASGLFQFIPRTARELGTTTFKILAMPADKQLEVYDRYMEKWLKPGTNARGKLAMLQAAPAFANDPDDTIVYPENSKAWKVNPGWRSPNNGDITVGSIKNYYRVS